VRRHAASAEDSDPDRAGRGAGARPARREVLRRLFAFGLFNASLFAASVLPLSTAYYVCEGLGWETGIDKKFREAPQFFGLYTALIAFGAVFILIPRFPLLAIMYLSQVLNGILLPFVLIFILLLVNRADLMGSYVNSRAYNIAAWSTTAIMIGLTVAMIGVCWSGIDWQSSIVA